MRYGGRAVIRKIILFGCTFGAIAYVAAWVVLAFPEEMTDWESQGRRVYFWSRASAGSMLTLGVGDAQWIPGEPRRKKQWNYELWFRVLPHRVSASLYDFTEGPSSVISKWIGWGGFSWGQDKGCDRIGEKEWRTIRVPSWFPFVLLAAYPALAFARGPLRRWRRRMRRFCIACGYDLMGNVSGVCPDCGRANYSVIRKVTLLGCMLGAVVYGAAWAVLAFPGETAHWTSWAQRVSFSRRASEGSRFTLRFGEPYPRCDHALEFECLPSQVRVSYRDYVADPSGIIPRTIQLGPFGWSQDKKGGRRSRQYVHQTIEVPSWFPFVILAAYPALAFIRGPLRHRRRRRRRKRGLCLGCGYDLTSNESGVCPECGRAIAP